MDIDAIVVTELEYRNLGERYGYPRLDGKISLVLDRREFSQASKVGLPNKLMLQNVFAKPAISTDNFKSSMIPQFPKMQLKLARRACPRSNVLLIIANA